MRVEIGSNFWEYSLQVKKQDSLWWQEDRFYQKYFKSGRNAIKALCQSLSNTKRTALLPIYTCETVIEPFRSENWGIFFYDINTDLTIDIVDLNNKIEQYTPAVLLIHSYFGFQTTNGLQKIIYTAKLNNIIIVEDITQSLFSKHYLRDADYYIGSLRKFLAIPDGGVLISRSNIVCEGVQKSDASIEDSALEAFRLKAEYFIKEDVEKKEQFRKAYQLLKEKIDKNDCLQEISEVSLRIFNNADYATLKQKRKNNYKTLYTELTHIQGLVPILDLRSEEETPLFLPVYIKGNERKEVQSYLAKRKIYCPIIWPVPQGLTNMNGKTKYIYDHILCFPIDQRYDGQDMKRIINCLQDCKFLQK